MFSKAKKELEINVEQHELLENAHLRIKQKKRLYTHFIVFLIASVFLFLINKVLKYGNTYNWFLWAITFWAFLFVMHLTHVFFTQKFLGRDWERRQREKLVRKQKEKIAQIQKEIETSFPLSQINKRKED